MAVKKTSSSQAQGASSSKSSGSKNTTRKTSSSKTASRKASSNKPRTSSKKRASSRRRVNKLQKALRKQLAQLKKRITAQGTAFAKFSARVFQGKGQKTTARRKRSKAAPRLSPLIVAFTAGILMAVICFIGIQNIQKSDKATQTLTQSAKINSEGRATPLVLPPVGNVGTDDSPLESNMEAALAIQQALAELQVATSTDKITQFTEQTKQTNFAFLQASVNSNIPSSHIRILQQNEKEHKLGQYTFQSLAIRGTADFPQVLANTLDSWHSGARLFRKKPNQYAISIQGVTTHEFTLYTNDGDFNKAFGTSVSPQTTPPSYPAKRPLNAPAHIVIVIDDLGASPKALSRLMRLNYPVTCAFWPDAVHTRKGAQLAHSAGLEILIHMPMEPVGYPKVKPGANALLASMSQQRIISLVQNAIHKVPHAVGLNNHMGSKFTQRRQQSRYVLNVLAQNKLFMLDSVTHGKTVFYDTASAFNIPRYKRSVFLDADDSPAAITASLAKTERIAKLTGQAIAIGHPLPATLAALEQWQHKRDTSIRVVRLQDLPNKGL